MKFYQLLLFVCLGGSSLYGTTLEVLVEQENKAMSFSVKRAGSSSYVVKGRFSYDTDNPNVATTEVLRKSVGINGRVSRTVVFYIDEIFFLFEKDEKNRSALYLAIARGNEEDIVNIKKVGFSTPNSFILKYNDFKGKLLVNDFEIVNTGDVVEMQHLPNKIVENIDEYSIDLSKEHIQYMEGNMEDMSFMDGVSFFSSPTEPISKQNESK